MQFFNSIVWIAISFLFFTALVAVISGWKTRGDNLDSAEGYFLAGRGLPGIVIAGSLLLTNLPQAGVGFAAAIALCILLEKAHLMQKIRGGALHA